MSQSGGDRTGGAPRRGPAPRRGRTGRGVRRGGRDHVIRASLLTLSVLLALGGTACGGDDGRKPDGEQDPTAAGARPDPVVFVHGLGGSSADWRTFRGWFQRNGYPTDRLLALDLPAGQPNDVNAWQLRDAVRRLLAETGAHQVDLVAFSMGNLSARHYLTMLGGTGRVDDFAGLAGPNRGMDTPLTEGCAAPERTETDACQMRRGSRFLRALNAGDPTPGHTTYVTWRSLSDEVVPAASTPLEGADNRLAPEGLGHVELLTDERVYREVRDALR
ncbi:triacylglycerol lipase [Streptomyces sp. AJS327]|uniref:esterase/lipase family protein n=1 Tax=Streptomyces sp. AJS327 TaxID=2545265 RepID=UPI0015DDDCF7|nr:alpha/beta fold hydrolase [Streptomyces sp. AJS327]